MAKLTPEEYLKQKTEVVSDKKISPEEYLAQKNTTKDTRVATDKVQTPEEYLANKQKTTTAPKSTLQKVGEFLVPTITKTIDKVKKGEDITKRDIVGSGLEAASYLIPGTAIAKGVGLGIKAGTLASKIAVPAAIGGVSGASFGAGQAVAEGEDLGGIAKRALKDTAIGAVAGGAIGAGLSKLAQRKAAQEAAKIIPEQTPVEVIPEVMPQPVTKVATEQVPVPKVEPKDYARYENALEKDPIFVKGAISNPDIINNYAKISKEVPTDELIDMVYGVNGKRLPNELPPSAVYNMLRSDVSKLTPKQAERLLNKQPLSKAGFDLQAAKIKSGEVITNPLEYADMIETQLKEKVASVGSVTKKSIKKFLDDNQCTLS